MKKLVGVLLILVLALNFGCGSDSSTEPDDGNNNGTVLGSGSVGPSGGTVIVEDLEISVPANTFPSTTQINVYSSTSQLSSISISNSFRITGIPENYSKGFTLRVKYQGALNGAGFIAVGTEFFTPSQNSLTTGYTYLPARDSAGYLCADVPSVDGGGNDILSKMSSMDNWEMNAEAVTPMELNTSGNHFKILVSPAYYSLADGIGNYLETAYSTFVGMNFDFVSQTSWPLKVIIRDLGDDDYGLYKRGWSEVLEINQRKLSEIEEMKTTAGHELFHVVQAKYDNRSWYAKWRNGNGPQYWLDEAVAVWIEGKFSTNLNYRSGTRSGNEMAPFRGMQKGSEADPAEHGYGMSAMIRYLVSGYGEDILNDIYDLIKAGSNPVSAVITATPDNIFDWWPVFQSFYTLGWVYNDITPLTITIDQNTSRFAVNTPSDTLHTFTANAYDLSGTFFDIKLDNPSFDPAAVMNLALTASNNCKMMVYAYNSSEITYLGYSDNVFSVAGLKAYKDNNWDVLVLVTNSRAVSPYTGTTPISLQVKIQVPVFDFSLIKYVGVSVTSEIHLDSTAVGKGSAWVNWTAPYQTVEGSFSGNTFTAATAPAWGTGEVSVTIDPINFVITSFRANAILNGHSSSISGSNLPFFWFQYNNQGVENGLAFLVAGTQACNFIDTYNRSNNDLVNGYVSDDFRCNDQSSVWVVLYWEAP